jgi:RNA polymerase sigma-70 factor (ECF subfamily)
MTVATVAVTSGSSAHRGRGVLDDDALMLRVQADDTGAFRVLFERHAAHALRAARAISAEFSEDALQDGFISVWRGRAAYRPCGGSVEAWILTIVRRRALDLVRAAGRERTTGGGSSADSITAPGSLEHDAIVRDDRELLREAIRGLPAVQREVVVLGFFGGLTHRQIASCLALPEGTVKGRMRLGLKRLRRKVMPLVPLGARPGNE